MSEVEYRQPLLLYHHLLLDWCGSQACPTRPAGTCRCTCPMPLHCPAKHHRAQRCARMRDGVCECDMALLVSYLPSLKTHTHTHTHTHAHTHKAYGRETNVNAVPFSAFVAMTLHIPAPVDAAAVLAEAAKVIAITKNPIVRGESESFRENLSSRGLFSASITTKL
jgi:hypothetical protein